MVATRFLAKRLGIDPLREPIRDIRYRGNGWPGEVCINGKVMPWEEAAALPYGKRLWRVPGCRSCPNPLGIGVDLTLADPWHIEPQDTVGMTMVMVWSQRGKDLLAAGRDLVMGRELDIDTVKESIGWNDLIKKQMLVGYYAGLAVPRNVMVAGGLERFQTRLYEMILDHHVKLPEIAYKILAHFPNLSDIPLS